MTYLTCLSYSSPILVFVNTLQCFITANMCI